MPHPPLGITARASVMRVIDGDTIEVSVHWPVTIRLQDCWAPEISGSERVSGMRSKKFLESLISQGDLVVFSVESEAAESLGDVLSFGRIVGNVWRPADDLSVSELMVREGFASSRK